MTHGLTFSTLRAANAMRLPTFRNAKGGYAHTTPDGSDWSLNDWVAAFTGEVGETANVIKKIRRGDFTVEEARIELGKEIADCVTYLDLLAMQLDIDLGAAVLSKFNEISNRVNSPIRIEADGSNYCFAQDGEEVYNTAMARFLPRESTEVS